MNSAESKLQEIVSASADPSIAESGGANNQQGVDFQRYWALLRMFDLKSSGANDFLLLFEAIQDIAELNSAASPTEIRICQLKKRSRGEWSFNELTAIPKPSKRAAAIEADSEKLADSPLGKLYRTATALPELEASAYFISNAGCDLPLQNGGHAAGTPSCCVTELASDYRDALSNGLAHLQEDPSVPVQLQRLHLMKTVLQPDDPMNHVVGVVHNYLSSNHPLHAGQAKALVDSLFVTVSKLNRQTGPAKDFAQLRKLRGYSQAELDEALNALESVPDLIAYLDDMLIQLASEGVPIEKRIALRAAATRFLTNSIAGKLSSEEKGLVQSCAQWVTTNPLEGPLTVYFGLAVAELSADSPNFSDVNIWAYVAIQAIKHARP